MLKFNDYVDIIVTVDYKNGRFKYYEIEANKKNLCTVQPYISSKRLEEYKKGNTEYFKELFNRNNYLIGEIVI